jgi:hypothetical protein
MKVRNGFVTNSSSSSFIGVFARIVDRDKAYNVMSNGLEKYTVLGKKILADMNSNFYGYGADWAGVDLTPRKESIDDNAEYIIWESWGGAGDDDSDFSKDGDWNLDYDVDLTDFRNEEQEIYNSISEKNGFEVIAHGYGAGRNG